MEFPILKTNRLKLIEISHRHVEDIFQILSRKDVTRFYGTNPFVLPSEATKLIEMFNKNYREKRGIRWGIILKENQKLIGTLGLNSLNLNNKRAEIGYELHPQYWRKGYITEAVGEVLVYSFEMLQLHRIGAVVYPENTASLHLLEKLGFLKEGLLRDYLFQNDHFHDTYILSLLKSDWEKRQNG